MSLVLTELSLSTMLSLCSNLRSLRIDGTSIESLKPNEDAHANGGPRLTSLCLNDVKISDADALEFVTKLADRDNVAAQTLERLQWDVSSADAEETLSFEKEFQQVFASIEMLTHLIHGGAIERIEVHGQRIPGRSPHQHQQLLAFLGGMHLLCTKGNLLDEHIRRHIWSFAEEQRHRSVCIQAYFTEDGYIAW